MKKYILWALALYFSIIAQAQAGDPPKYEVSKIPAELLKGANAVIRADEEILDIQGIGRAIKKMRFAVTILNEEAIHYATKRLSYYKLFKINRLEGMVYDQYGKVIAKLKKSDIQDNGTFDGVSFVSDSRVKVATFARTAYPFTVEFEYEAEDLNLMHYETWYVQSDPKAAVESSVIEVVVPADFPDLRYHTQNLTNKVEISSTSEGKKIYRWTWKNLPVMPKTEPNSPLGLQSLPVLSITPTTFEVEGYKGEMNSWEALGKWQLLLNAGREELPAETQAKVRELVANIPSKEAKIKVLYEYMQSRTRYVGIQLGIGGWQPFPASEVDSKGYGDCKALSNYMKALLNVVGIESHYTLIKAGKTEKDDFIPNFPSSQFNHIVLCVPLERDTTWLECTSQSQAVGYMGDFTGDRYALAITPEGGKLIRTPRYTRKDNFLHRKAEVQISAEGHATAQIQTQYSGLQQDEGYIDRYATFAPDEQKKWLYEKIKLANFEIKSFQLTRQKTRIPVVTENLSLQINALAAKSGKRLFLQPNLLSKWEVLPAEMENRRSAVEVSLYDYVDNDTIQFQLPEGYFLEHKPEDVAFKSAFGEYQASVKFEGRTVTYIRKMSVNRGSFPKEKHKEWVTFCQSVAKADRMKIVVVSTT